MEVVTPEWVKDAVFYQIFPDRFAKSDRFGVNGYLPKPQKLQAWGEPPTFHSFQGGDLLGICEKLDYLVDLGVTAIYLNPIFSSASNHRYHTHDYYNVDPILGGNRAFREFLDGAHAKGLRVILDGVFNHASRGFFQFNHVMECGAESPYVDWFHIHGFPVNAFNQHQPPNYDAWWGMHSLPKLNTRTTAVREFLWGVATYWIEQGIDGWRLDVPNEIDDDQFWREFRRRVRAINPEAFIVGEFWGEAHRWLQGDQFDGQMNYMVARALLGFFVRHNMDQTDTVRCGYGYIHPLNGYQFGAELDRNFNRLYHPNVVLSNLNMLGSHDTPRTGTVARNDKAAWRLMLLCQMTLPGVPNIYYGDEIGMLGGHDPHCRGAFPWNKKEQWDTQLRDDLKQYIQLRRETPALRRGSFEVLLTNEYVIMYRREYQGQTAVVAFNTNEHGETIAAPHGLATPLRAVLGPVKRPLQSGEQYSLPACSGQVWVS